MKVFAKGEKLDLQEREVVAVTLTADSLENVQVNSSFTNSFEFPLSARNRRLIGNLQALQGALLTSDNDIRLEGESGELLIEAGQLVVTQINNRRAKANILQGATQFLQLVGESSLQDLPIGAIGTAVERTEANIVANINNTSASGYTYGLIDIGQSPANTFDVSEFYPATYFRALVELIAQQAGYTVLNEGLFTDDLFNETVLHWSGTRYNEDSQFRASIEGFITTAGATPTYQNVYVSDTVIPSENFGEYGFFVTGPNKALFFEAFADVEILTSAGGYEYNMRIYNETQGITYAQFNSGVVAGTGTVTTSFALRTGLLKANAGDRIVLQIDAVQGLNFEFTSGLFRNDDNRQNTSGTITDLYNDPPAGFVFDPLTTLPDLPQADFIKAVLAMFNAKIDANNVTKQVRFVLFKDYASQAQQNGAENITGKLDYSKDIQISTYYGSYAKRNLLLYDNDEPLPEYFGSAVIEVDNVQADSEEEELIKLPFSGTQRNGQYRLIPLLLTGNEIDVLNPRPLHAVSESVSVTIGSTSVATANVLDFAKLSFQATEIDGLNTREIGLKFVYYSEFERALQDMQKLEITLKKNALDFASLDFFKQQYLYFSDGFTTFSGFYLLQEVKEYRGNGTTKVQLIRLNNAI